MNIGFNALGLKSKSGGIETYIYNVINSILQTDQTNSYTLFIADNNKHIFQPLISNYKNFKIVSYPFNSNNSVIRVIFENTLLNIGCIINRINLVHHFCNYVPRIFFTKSVVTVHDLGGFFYAENYPNYARMHNYSQYMKRELAYTLKKAKYIIAISNFTKSEIIKYYPSVNSNKIKIIGQSLDVRKNYSIIHSTEISLTSPYILCVSVIRPHKNIDFLIKSFNKLKSEYKIPHQLVLVGGVQLESDDFEKELNSSEFKDDIKHLGYVDNETLSELYSNASVYVFPSLYEGFGIPILEAMKYNLPIAASNKASIPEVGQDACLYFDPYSIDSCCKTLLEILNKNFDIQKTQEKQKICLEHWNWIKIAPKFIDCYKEVMDV